MNLVKYIQAASEQYKPIGTAFHVSHSANSSITLNFSADFRLSFSLQCLLRRPRKESRSVLPGETFIEALQTTPSSPLSAISPAGHIRPERILLLAISGVHTLTRFFLFLFVFSEKGDSVLLYNII